MHADNTRPASPCLCSQLNKTLPSHHFDSMLPVERPSTRQALAVTCKAHRERGGVRDRERGEMEIESKKERLKKKMCESVILLRGSTAVKGAKTF